VSERAKRRRRRTVRKCNCRECGNAFEAHRTTARFCSNACRQKGHRNAKRQPIT
jgi:hypothetical protein